MQSLVTFAESGIVGGTGHVCVCACACSPLTSEVPKKVFLGTFNGVYEMNNIVEALASAFEPEDMKHGHREH